MIASRPAIAPPTLATARLTLRPQRMADFAAFARTLASPRARYMGGPLDRDMAWLWFASDEAQWSLCGWGALSVVETASGRLAGQVAVLQPPRFPETELGWMAHRWAEGRGYMSEAAAALRDWAFGPRGLTTLVSYIDADNSRSCRLAERLGARLEPDAARVDAGDLVYRHHRPAP